jgi:hypothetical protein
MTKIDLIQHARKLSVTHPHLKDEIYDFVYLAIDEIDEGGSEMHEVELALNDINQLIKNDEKSNLIS